MEFAYGMLAPENQFLLTILPLVCRIVASDAYPGPPGRRADLEPEAARKGTGMRVLLIEDDRATAQSIELMLKSESFNIYTTDLGEEGVDLGKLYDYDIILLDLNLPDMSGRFKSSRMMS